MTGVHDDSLLRTEDRFVFAAMSEAARTEICAVLAEMCWEQLKDHPTVPMVEA